MSSEQRQWSEHLSCTAEHNVAPREKAPASDFLVVFATAATHEQAENIAQLLVTERLAACVTVVPEVRSCYRWQDQICKDQESLLIIKTRAALFARLSDRIRQVHSYEVPEILALPVTDGAPSYLQWLLDATRRDDDRG